MERRMPLKWHVRCDPGEKEPKQVMLRGYLPIGLKGRLPPTEPESWRMGDAPDKFLERTGHVAISQGVYGRGKGQEGYG